MTERVTTCSDRDNPGSYPLLAISSQRLWTNISRSSNGRAKDSVGRFLNFVSSNKVVALPVEAEF